MTITEKRRIMLKAATMYYLEDMTQSQIAKKLGINRTTISRILTKAREMGIVKIEIGSSFNNERIKLERDLEKKLELKEVLLVENKIGETKEEIKEKLGKASVEYLKRIIKDGDVIGFSWGTTIGSICNYLIDFRKVDADIVPLVGGTLNEENDYHVNPIVHKVANAFNSRAHFIYAPAITEKKETKYAIINDANFKKINELWGKVNKAFVGLGTPLSSLNAKWTELLSQEDKDYLKKMNTVGDICARFYDINGKIIKSDIDDRTIAIDMNRFKEIEYIVGIAASSEKVQSIYAAAKGKLINVLITDVNTGKQLLKYKEEIIR